MQEDDVASSVSSCFILNLINLFHFKFTSIDLYDKYQGCKKI